jgi:hypothetical protein
VSSPLDDHIRSVLDRIRVTVGGQLEADLTASTADIIRAVANEQQQALLDVAERAAEDMRLVEARLSIVRAEFEAEREELRRSAACEIAALERVLAEVRDELAAARRTLDDAQRAKTVLEQQLEQARRSEEGSKSELESLRAKLARTARLTTAFRALDQATSLGDILDSLAQTAFHESGRTAVFLVNGERLRGWRVLGFDEAGPIVGADFCADESDVVGRAVRSGTGQQHRNGDNALVPAFAAAQSPRDAVALPVHVGGSVIAVLYADAARADRPEEAEWLDTIPAIAKHAGRMLESMTIRQAAALWIPGPRTAQPALDSERAATVYPGTRLC